MSKIRFSAFLLGLALSVSAVSAAEAVRYQGIPNKSSITIDGTSTVHDWTVKGTLIGGYMDVEGAFPSDLSVTEVPALPDLPKVMVRIPVNSLKSGKSTMDSVMHKAMNKSKHPMIAYAVTKMVPSTKSRKAGDPLRYETEGELKVSGKTKQVKMPVFITGRADGGLDISGKTKVKMTDFGIKPPAPKIALGLIKTGDEVDLTFKWATRKK